MRRKDREITNFNQMLEILSHCDCCRIGLIDGDSTYIVPLNFGYDSETDNLVLYFHSAKEGKKLDLLKNQQTVGFELDCKHEVVKGNIACAYSFHYQSIIGKGKIGQMKSYEEKVFGLKKIMNHYTKKDGWKFKEEMVNRVAVLKMTVLEWSCKEYQ